MVGLDGSVVSIANAEIARDLNATTAELQWVTNSYLLALAAALILGGKLGDRFGRRTLYLVGVVGFTAASVAIGLAGSIEGVIAFRALQGLFGAMLMPNTLALLRAVFPPKKFGMAVGIWAMISSVSTALGPIVGGLLVEHVNWESVFYINAPIGVIALVFGLVVLPQSRNEAAASEKFDVPGVVLLAGGLLAVVFGVVKGETWGWTSVGTLGAIIGGLVVLVLFGWYETRVSHPLLPMRLFRNPALTIGTVVTALNFFILLGVIFFVMLYLQNVRGFTPVEAGVRTLPLSLVSMVASPLGAKLTEKFGPRLTMPLGMVLQAGAAFAMLAWSADSSYATMWPPFAALGLGVGMVMSASSDAIVGNAPVKDGGVAGGLQATSLQIGGALGTSVLVSIISSRVGSTLTDSLTDAGVPDSAAARLRGGEGRGRDGRRPGHRRDARTAQGGRRRGQPDRLHERRPHRRPRHRHPRPRRRLPRGDRPPRPRRRAGVEPGFLRGRARRHPGPATHDGHPDGDRERRSRTPVLRRHTGQRPCPRGRVARPCRGPPSR